MKTTAEVRSKDAWLITVHWTTYTLHSVNYCIHTASKPTYYPKGTKLTLIAHHPHGYDGAHWSGRTDFETPIKNGYNVTAFAPEGYPDAVVLVYSGYSNAYRWVS